MILICGPSVRRCTPRSTARCDAARWCTTPAGVRRSGPRPQRGCRRGQLAAGGDRRGGPPCGLPGPRPMSSALLGSLTGQLVRAVEEARMAVPKVVSRQPWVGARLALLAREKELTRRRDAVNAQGAGWRWPRLRRTTSSAARGDRSRSTGCSARAAGWVSGTSWPTRAGTPPARPARGSAAKPPTCQSRGWAPEDRGLPGRAGPEGALGLLLGSGIDCDLRVPLDKPAPQPGPAGGGRSCELPGVGCVLRDGGEFVPANWRCLGV